MLKPKLFVTMFPDGISKLLVSIINPRQSKKFPSFIMVITGVNSAVGLHLMTVRYLFLYDVDAYPQEVDSENFPLSFDIQRTTTFLPSKKGISQ